MSIRPKQLSRIGEFHLQEALLDVLCDAYPKGFGVGAAEISRRAGIYREPGIMNMNDAIVHGLLNLLYDEGKVERAPQAPPPTGSEPRGGWKLTEKEYNRRRDDIERNG